MPDTSLPCRQSALDRLTANAPFLARLADLNPEDVTRFLADGADAALAALAAPAVDDDIMRALRLWRGRVALLLALGDLSGEHDVAATTRHLSDFADTACDIALAAAFADRVPDDAPRGLSVIALGKLGSRELNYSSDIDPILIFDPETLPRRSRDDPGEAAVRVARRFVEILSARTADGHVLRVDLRLRPHPEVTPIVLPVNAAISYYESEALAWEQAAFIRSRASAGDRALGHDFLAAIQPFIWRRSLDFRQLKEIGAMSDRIRDHFAQGQDFGPGYDLKRGRGGIREIEFFTQVHQLIYGGREPALRVPATVDALAALAKAGRVEPAIAARLSKHYALLRRVEHRLQMVEDQQTHSLPVQDAALDAVARLDGHADGAALLDALRPAVEDVGACYDRIVAERAVASGLPRDEGELADALAAAGFDPPGAALRTIAEWRSGQVRALRSAPALEALEAVLPGLVKALGATPDPAAALLRFDKLVAGLPSAVGFFHLLAAQPALARGYSDLAEAALQRLADATVAEFVAAHGRVPGSELVILALGRFGGQALTHASDLDLIYLFTGDHLAESDGPRPLGATTYYNRLAQRVTGAMSVPTAAGKLYEVDVRLRPQGAQGPLVVTLDSFERYQREEAWTWEHMALLRARAVYGSEAARASVARIVSAILAVPRDRGAIASDAAEMRDKIAAHKPPHGALDVKGGPGGLVDLEFAMQVTQLASGQGQTPHIPAALADLAAAGLAPAGIVAAHRLLVRLLVMLRLTAPAGEPQTAAARQLVAAACGCDDWDAMLAAHAAARQEVADWWAAIRPAGEPQEEEI